MKLVLIPVGPCEWRSDGRLLGRVELPLTEGADTAVDAWTDALADVSLGQLFCAPDELASLTAKRIAKQLHVTAKSREGLAEVDLGLWAGLTADELKSRYASAHRELCDAPLNVHPPQGEDFSSAAKRLRRSVQTILKKNGKTNAGLVVRPLAFAMLRKMLGVADGESVWEMARAADAPLVIDSPQLAAEA